MQTYIFTLRQYPAARHLIRAKSLEEGWDGFAKLVGFTSFATMCKVQRLDPKEHKAKFKVEVI